MAYYIPFVYIAVIIIIILILIFFYCCFRLNNRREIRERTRNAIIREQLAVISVLRDGRRDVRQQNHTVQITDQPIYLSEPKDNMCRLGVRNYW